MAIETLLEKKKKQQKLLIVLGVVVLATLLILYFGIWNKRGGSEIVIGTGDAVPSNDAQSSQGRLSSVLLEEKLKKVDLNIDFFNQTILPFLKMYGDLPVKKGDTGRLNPFIAQ